MNAFFALGVVFLGLDFALSRKIARAKGQVREDLVMTLRSVITATILIVAPHAQTSGQTRPPPGRNGLYVMALTRRRSSPHFSQGALHVR